MIMNMHGWISTGQRISKGGGGKISNVVVIKKILKKLKLGKIDIQARIFFIIIKKTGLNAHFPLL